MSLPPKILLATSNAHKVAEMRAILSDLLPAGMELVSLDEIGLLSPPDEIERYATFTANARAKAEWCREHSGLTCIADDSGICIDALGGRPGIHSARWAGPDASARDRNELLIAELKHAGAITPQQRRGHYACSVAFAYPQSTSHFPDTLSAFGIMPGYVLQSTDLSPLGGGFGYDPIFFSLELGNSVANASAAEKNWHSHRGKALRSLLNTAVVNS